MKRAVVCGAGGFIASHLVKRLKRDGYWVRGVDIKEPEFAPTQADEFRLLDLRDMDQCREALKSANDRPIDSYEFQMLYGIRPNEQRRLTELGHPVRVYTPYGVDWYGYFMRRLAERPANLFFILRNMFRS